MSLGHCIELAFKDSRPGSLLHGCKSTVNSKEVFSGGTFAPHETGFVPVHMLFMSLP